MESKTEGKMAAELDRDSKHDDADAGGDDTLVVAKGGSESCFVVGSAKAADSGSLQDAFNKFRRERSRALKLKAKQRAAEAKDPSLRAARADKLRAQFLEQAHKYKGVPYAQKYFEPGTEDFEAPLFLDCCGIIRKVMDDLQEEFGFRIGRWNQAYMFDTLDFAANERTPETMQPGDLVFYTGDYVSPKAKKQKHDMVHVEIWLGDGEKTIGARWHKGHVQVFDTCNFKPSSYTNVKHHFRSIDPWLAGKCESHCEEHPWEVKGFSDAPNAKSVFFDGEGQDAEGECASDGDDDGDVADAPTAIMGRATITESKGGE